MSPKRNSVLATVVICFLFIVSVALGIRKERISTAHQTIEKTLANAQYALDEGVALITLNPIKARTRLAEAAGLLGSIERTVSPRSKEGRLTAKLAREIADNLIIAQAIVKVEPQLFYDVSLLKKNAVISDMAMYGRFVALLDRSTKTMYALDIVTKNGQVIAGGESFSSVSLVGLQGNTLYSLVGQGIHAVSMETKKVSPLIVKKDAEWGSISSLVAFGGNLYLLDIDKNRIWKYVATEDNFSELREYLNPDTLPNLSTTTNMAIDGSVWLGTTDGNILRFTQGKEASFVPRGVEPAFGQLLVVYTTDSTNNVYVLDQSQRRVVVLDKDGLYVSQYVWEGSVQPTGLVVSEEQKKLLLLAEGKLYSIGLK